MAQTGGSKTQITRKTQLIILDCFETVVTMEKRSYVPRHGVHAFLRHFEAQGVNMVIHSDATRDLVDKALGQAGLSDAFDAIYDAENAGESLDDETALKCLDVPMRDYGVTREQTVFIGDSPMDAISAHNYEVPFIRVPRSEDQTFTFAMLISGPSRYSSEVFEQILDEFYDEE